jgi:hypothetical protein
MIAMTMNTNKAYENMTRDINRARKTQPKTPIEPYESMTKNTNKALGEHNH